jgi:diketogulonate reductase-like aldo/keto reductase
MITRRELLVGAGALALASRARAQATSLRVGLGTWRVFDGGRGAELLRTFAELGGTVVDTAPSYGTEGVIGAAQVRGLFVATKLAAMGRKACEAEVNASMKALRVERLDLVQVHNLVHLDDALDVLTGLKQDGKVRMIGVSHFTASGHDDLERVLRRRDVDWVQVNYSAGEREAEKRVLPTARDRNVRVMVNRPFMGGDLLRIANRKRVPDGFTSWSDALLSFAISHPAVTCAIPATSNVTHLRENLRARLLSESECERAIRALA